MSDVLGCQGDVSGSIGNVLDGQEDLSECMGVPFVGTADVNGTHRERFGFGMQRVADSLWGRQ